MIHSAISKLLLIAVLLGLSSCNNTQQQQQQRENGTTNPEPNKITAQDIVDQAIAYYGGDNYNQAEIHFTFRDHDYRSVQQGGQYILERIKYNPAIGKVTDEVTNSGYRNVLNDEFAVDIVDSMKVKITNSVNSVHYFARLPYGLNAPATIKELIGIDIVNDQRYYEVKVTFKQEGGGVDFQDVFVYWFSMETFQMDYLAYSYQTDGGGIRFRAAKNMRDINGIRFQDYINYKPKSLDVTLADLDQMYAEGELIEVSQITLENIAVDLLNEQ